MSATDLLRDQGRPATASAEPLGQVSSISGSQVSVGLLANNPGSLHAAAMTVGKFVKMMSGNALLVGVVTDVSGPGSPTAKDQRYHATALVDLMGEIERSAAPPRFRRGVANYTTIGDSVAPLSNDEMRVIFDNPGSKSVKIGHLQQDSKVAVGVDIDEMLSKHFAVLGTTGVGKSSAVALVLHQILRARPNLRLLLLDVHNEYGRCFGERAYVVNPANLRLPFWLFNFEEIVDVFFAGRPGSEEEIEILSEVIPLAKIAYTQYRASAERVAIKKVDPKSIGYTVDTPVPYRLQDLLLMIDERMGKLENRSSRMIYHKLISRIEMVGSDSRYAFMFENANVGGDTMAEAISQLFRLPPGDKPMTILQLAGFPAEVVDSVVSVMCRMAFDFGLWSNGASPLLVVCEEAHRYAAADRTIGFGPTRRAISKIAKEGRKHGVFLGLVTQRPAELDATIISQCSTLFAMRMSNERDQALLQSAVSDTAANLFSFVPSLGTREALAFGVGVPLPTRLSFAELPQALLPKSDAFGKEGALPARAHDLDFIASVIERWRGSTVSHRINAEEPAREVKPVVNPDAVPLAPRPATDLSRLSLLRKPAANQTDHYAALTEAMSPPKR